jgi:hypothetical protein
MRAFAIFGDSFLDGFTMSGFLNRLRRPDEAVRMFGPARPASTSEWQGVSFRIDSAANEVLVSGSLSSVPEQTLHTMIDLLKREDEDRKMSRNVTEGAVHGSSR